MTIYNKYDIFVNKNECSYIFYRNQFYSIDNLTLPVEAAITEEREKQGYVNVPEKILDNVSLETIKVLEVLSKEASVKPRNQNGIPIVSNYFE